jgi:hypothetical protein
MELTKSETEIAERWISKRERQLAQWPRRRRLILAIFAVFALLGYRTASDGMRSIHDEKTIDSFVSATIGAAPPSGLEQRWAVGTQLKIAKLLETRQQEVAYSVLEVGLGYLEVLSAATMLCLVILRSKTVERDALICKLLRGKLQELEPSGSSEPGDGAQVDKRGSVPPAR